MSMEREQIERHEAFSQPWYYRLELAPGLLTDGNDRPNVALTRQLLAKVELGAGTRCLDIGIQEGLVSILMERRGANVVSYDRTYSEERLGLVRDALETEFELIGEPVTHHTERLWLGRGGQAPGVGMPLPRLPAELAARGHGPFDAVIYSGVLYHVYDPLSSLALVRGLVRHGGIVIVETAAVHDGRLSLNLNARSRFTPLAIWLPSLGVLDYMLRLVRLRPIDVVHMGRKRGRVGIACRAVDAPPAAPGDEWIHSPLHEYELAEYLDWAELASDRPPVEYAGGDERVDVADAVGANTPLRPEPAQQRLDLGAVT